MQPALHLFPRGPTLLKAAHRTHSAILFLKNYIFDLNHFFTSIEICHNIVSVLCSGFLTRKLVGSSGSQPEIKPAPPALQGRVLTADRQEVPESTFI